MARRKVQRFKDGSSLEWLPGGTMVLREHKAADPLLLQETNQTYSLNVPPADRENPFLGRLARR
jgi:hypothetical protein